MGEQKTSDCISRCDVIDVVRKNTFRLTFAEEQGCEGHVAWSAEAVYSDVIEGALLELPSAQPDLTLESAIDYLHSIGWMQNHDKEITDSAYREGHTAAESKYRAMWDEMQATQPERKTGKWINAYPDIEPNPMLMYGICSVCGFEQSISDKLQYCPSCGARMVQEGEDR